MMFLVFVSGQNPSTYNFHSWYGGCFDSEQKAKEVCDKFNNRGYKRWATAKYVQITEEDMNVDLINTYDPIPAKLKIYGRNIKIH